MSKFAPSPRPFTQAINKKRDEGMRFVDLEAGSNRARSTAWFNYLVNSTDPWKVNPPTKDTFTGLRKLLGVSEQVLKNMVAIEWYASSPDNVSARVAMLADAIDDLSEEDAGMLGAFIARLHGGIVEVTSVIPPQDRKASRVVKSTRRVIEPSLREDLFVEPSGEGSIHKVI